MKLFMLALVIAGAASATPATQRDCREVEGERILARDLAAAIPAFHALAPQMPVAFAPLPGSRRIMHASELVSLARRNSIEFATLEDLCFEWPMRPLERAAVMEAMRGSLAADAPDAAIEILELSSNPAPRGRIEFPEITWEPHRRRRAAACALARQRGLRGCPSLRDLGARVRYRHACAGRSRGKPAGRAAGGASTTPARNLPGIPDAGETRRLHRAGRRTSPLRPVPAALRSTWTS